MMIMPLLSVLIIAAILLRCRYTTYRSVGAGVDLK